MANRWYSVAFDFKLWEKTDTHKIELKFNYFTGVSHHTEEYFTYVMKTSIMVGGTWAWPGDIQQPAMGCHRKKP